MITAHETRFNVQGKVQGVFFRRSFTYLLERNGLSGGATNDKQNKKLVHCTVSGEVKAIDQFIESLIKLIESKEKFNSFGARIENLTLIDHGITWTDHDSNTAAYPNETLPLGLKVHDIDISLL